MSDSPIGSVDNALRLLAAFQDHSELRVADVSRMLGVARSTAHRLLRVLVTHGFATQNEETKSYEVGPALLRLAISISHQLDLVTVARPVMTELAADLGETIHLVILQGADVFFLDSVESSRTLRVGGRAGDLRPAYATSTGRVLLASLDAAERHAHLPATLAPITSRTITDRGQLDTLLTTVREQGYASNLGESEEDVAAVAVPVRTASGKVAAALAAAAPPSRLDTADIPAIAAKLAAGATRIGSLLR